MAEFPYLPLWTDAYLADTRHLSTVEHGAYLLLMMEAWRRPNCSLPDDDRMLARLAGLSHEEWCEIKDVVMDFWTLDGRSKTWVQKRLLKERSKSAGRSQVARDNATKRWNSKKKGDAMAKRPQCLKNAIQNQNQNHNNTPLPPKGGGELPLEEPKAKELKPIDLLRDVVGEEAASAFVEHRNRIRKPMTAHAAKLMAGQLRQMPNPQASINQSILNGWAGVFPLKDGPQDGGPSFRKRNYGV